VHFSTLPRAEEEFIDKEIERKCLAMRTVIEFVRTLRERRGIPVKYPLKQLVVISRDSQFLDDLKTLETYILAEANAVEMVMSQDKHKYGVQLKADPDFKQLGIRLKGDQKIVVNYLKNSVTEEELEDLLKLGKMNVNGFELTSEEVRVSFTFDSKNTDSGEKWEVTANNFCVVMIDATEDPELIARGLVREVANRIQKLRKSGGLLETDKALVYCLVTPEGGLLSNAIKDQREALEQMTNTPMRDGPPPVGQKAIIENSSLVKAEEVKLWLTSEL